MNIYSINPSLHQYKFIVDGRETVAKDQPTAVEASGERVNIVRIEEPENGAWICGAVQDGKGRDVCGLGFIFFVCEKCFFFVNFFLLYFYIRLCM